MSRKRYSAPLEQPPAEIIRGAQIMAEYRPQKVSDFSNNPLVEALPPVLTPQEVKEYLFQVPPYSDRDRELDVEERIQMTEKAREFFVPDGRHLTVYYALMNLIRRGYVRRNPVLWGHWKRVHENIESFLKAVKARPFPNSRARGMTIVGSGGTGKSTTVEKILQSVPQVIIHASYGGQDFIMKQLVWLKLDCPRDGSLRQLCVHFFRVVDEILGTQYEKNYARTNRRTLEDLISGMARVASNHCLGILVIDEIQDLSESRSGGDTTMVNFFVHLENALGVPFAFIGTPNVKPILGKQFRQLRRVSEQGYVFWDRMSEVDPGPEESDDEEDEAAAGAAAASGSTSSRGSEGNQQRLPQPGLAWKNFAETMWTYQYVKKPRPLADNVAQDECAHALYTLAKGVPAVVQTVFVLAQQRAILTGEERLTPKLIRDTVRANQEEIKEALGEARMRRPIGVGPVDDLSDFDQIFEAEDLLLASPNSASVNGTKSVTPTGPEAGEVTGAKARQRQGAKKSRSKSKQGRPPSGGNKAKSSKGPTRTGAGPMKSDLPSPSSLAGRSTKGRGSSTKDGFAKSPDEYLEGE